MATRPAQEGSPARASTKVCVFGSGSFGTALGTVVARNGFAVTVLTRREDVAGSINEKHINPQHLSGCKLPPLLSATTSAEEALAGVSFIVHCIPVQATEPFLEPLRALIPKDVPIISTSKGVHSETLETMAELVPRVLGGPQPMAFLSGPTFAQELMDANPSGAVCASADAGLADAAAQLFHCPSMRCYTTSDVIGVEVAGAVKNVYALAAGAVEGMGLGNNSVAFLVTRACAEMNMLAVAMGARAHTMAGLAGMGDLVLTCMGGKSRNKAVGARIGRGEPLSAILESRKQTLEGVAEGVATAPAVVRLAKRHGVSMPLADAVAAVLEGQAKPQQAIMLLMQQPRHEDFAAAAHEAERELARQRQRPEGSGASGRADSGPSPLGLSGTAWAVLAIAQAALLGCLAARSLRSRRGT